MLLIASSLSHKMKRFRSFFIFTVTLVAMFYYTFLNEEYSMNQYLDEEELPRITTTNSDLSSEQPIQLSKEEQESLKLATYEGLLEKNKYFPLLTPEKARSKIQSIIPEEYIKNQLNVKLSDFKRHSYYPVGAENFHKFPKISKAETYNSIQSSYFSDGGLKDVAKLEQISHAFDSSWKTYAENGYGHDEVLPLSHSPEDPFNGWAATLVDSLDTMILMGKTSEFKKAVKFISKMNFKQSYRYDVPLFENVIRILAGLISGYEMGNKEKVLLDKAIELADFLLDAFDTPNRMPLLYYEWSNEIQNRFASGDAALAEIGSLSLEFSRLTQLTKDNKYFDAITRITKTFANSKDNGFYVPGLYTNRIDISGCKVLSDEEIEKGVHLNNPKVIKTIHSDNYVYCLKTDKLKPTERVQRYAIGGLADSFYEYLPKMYHLLGGNSKHSEDYKAMYLSAIKQMKDYMIFKPKIPENDDILFISSITAHSKELLGIQEIEIQQELDMQHLSCFAGGMFAMGGRLFDIPEDIQLAEKLTMGCVEMYKRLKIMPEVLWVDQMVNKTDVYDEKARMELIKPKPVVQLQLDSEAGEDEKTKSIKNDVTGDKGEKGDFSIGVIDNEDPELKKAIEEDKSKLQKRSAHPMTSHTPSPNYDVFTKKIVYQEPRGQRFSPQRTLPDGSTVWPIGGVANQPVWINKMEAKYILRPEAIESVFYMYRVTGDAKWREYGWEMWQNIVTYAKTKDNEFASVLDVTRLKDVITKQKRDLSDFTDEREVEEAISKDDEVNANFMDTLESFWFSETLKYFYLLFEDISVWSLDEVVFNTEAHPFKLEGL